MPEGNAETQFRLPLQLEFAALDGDFKYPFKTSFRHIFGVQEAQLAGFNSKLLQVTTFKLDYNGHLFCCADRDAKFRIFKFS